METPTKIPGVTQRWKKGGLGSRGARGPVEPLISLLSHPPSQRQPTGTSDASRDACSDAPRPAAPTPAHSSPAFICCLPVTTLLFALFPLPSSSSFFPLSPPSLQLTCFFPLPNCLVNGGALHAFYTPTPTPTHPRTQHSSEGAPGGLGPTQLQLPLLHPPTSTPLCPQC